MIFILHLGLGKGCLTGRTPVDRFLSLIDRTIQEKLAEFPDNCGLITEIHCQIRVLPFSENAEPFELLPLDIYEFGRIIPALLPDIHGGELHFLLSETLLNLMLNRQSMTVPARHIMAVKTGHKLRLHNDILQDLIQCCSNVNIPVRIGRAIVKDIFCPLLCLPDQFPVNSSGLPHLQKFRLSFGQIGPHGKVSLRKIERVAVIHFDSLFSVTL